MGFDLNKDKMRCLMVLDDGLASKLSCKAGPSFCRGFILENRKTHEVYALYRFKYEDGERSWFKIASKKEASAEAMTEELRCAIEDVLKLGLIVFGVDAEMIDNAVHCYYPPDDGGDPGKTLIWLEQQDLIEFTVEKAPESEKGV